MRALLLRIVIRGDDVMSEADKNEFATDVYEVMTNQTLDLLHGKTAERSEQVHCVGIAAGLCSYDAKCGTVDFIDVYEVHDCREDANPAKDKGTSSETLA